MAVQNQQGYDKLIGLGYSAADAAKQADATKPNPNFNPVYQSGNIPAGYTGTYRSAESGQDITLQNGQALNQGTAVDTSQPSPKPTQVTPTLGSNTQSQLPYNQALKGLQSGGLKGADLAGATQNLKNKYQVGLSNAQNSGTGAPQSGGAGSAGAQSNLPLPEPKPQTNPIDSALKDDQGYQQLLADHTAYQNSVNQRQSLTQEYQTLSNALGLSALNTQLMDMKKVIDGTEDDIRTEVTKAAGFATNSQVLAMSSARNKVIIQNYNNLLQTKQDAQAQLTTLIGLSEKDRAQADQQFNQQMQYDQKIADYRDKAVANAKSGFDKIISAPGYGYEALYSSTGGDPTTVANVEQTLGLKPGMLQTLASQAPKDLQYISGTANQAAGTFDKTTGKFTPLPGGGGAGGGGGTTPIDNTPVDPQSQSILAQTGLSIPAFSFLTQGSTALTRMSAQQRLAYMNEAQNYLNKKGVDISTFQSQYKAQNDVLQKSIERSANTQIFAGEVAGSADALASVIDEKDLKPGFFSSLLGNSSFKAANIASLALGEQVNDPLTQKYATQLNAMTNDYAGYLAASRGATAPDMNDTREAARVISNGLNKGSVTAFKEAVQANEKKVSAVVDKATANAQDKVWNLFGVTRPSATSKGTTQASNNTTKSGKTFDAAAAKAAGYTDAQIQDYLNSH